MRTLASFLISSIAFGSLNYAHFHRVAYCTDCFVFYGLPFTFVREGGFVGTTSILWSGLFADLLAVVVVSLVLAEFWKRQSARLTRNKGGGTHRGDL